MAKIRFGYSDDFTAKNSKVGINTTDSQANLDVIGVVKGQDLKVTGISSQTGYEGFLRADHSLVRLLLELVLLLQLQGLALEPQWLAMVVTR